MKRFASLFIPFAFFLPGYPNLLNATVTLPSFFSDNMVLQQKTEAAIWGWAKSNGTVQLTSSWNKKKYTVQADQSGKWKLKISTPEAGGVRTGFRCLYPGFSK